MTLTTIVNGNTGVGIALAGASLATVGSSAVGGVITHRGGSIYLNGLSVSGMSLGARSNGNIIGIALDPGLEKVWVRVCPAGNWDGVATDNPRPEPAEFLSHH